ncbi:MAG: MotA/TolQ/ExbB proton channel family protein [Desulfobacteraceae bacterium]|nr:MotA/TolQ/ExbB proton channel family protein [Desulfobacteraceae bacterium]
MEPWFAPKQIITALGITFPLFIIFMYLIYHNILKFEDEYKTFRDKGDPEKWKNWIRTEFPDEYIRDISEENHIDEVFDEFEKRFRPILDNLDIYVEITMFIGFLGTLLGVLASFASLQMTVESRGLEPAFALKTLLKGGLSTALVTSLISVSVIIFLLFYNSLANNKLIVLFTDIKSFCRKRIRGN